MILNLGGGAGMSAETEEKIDAILQAVTLAGLSFELECAQNNKVNTNTTITIQRNYKYLVSILIANQGTKTASVSSDDAGTKITEIVTTDGNTRNCIVAIYRKENVSAGDTITMFGTWESSAILIGIN